MKILATIGNVLAIVAIVLLNSIGIASHASAIATASHDMGAMSHSYEDTGSCATLCRTALVNQNTNNINRPDNEDDEDDPIVAFYAASQSWLLSDKTEKQRLYADAIKPPPKIPVYILYGVFRV